MRELLFTAAFLTAYFIGYGNEQDSIFAEASRMYENENYDKAFVLMDGLIQEGFNSSALYYNYANVCYQKGEYSKAIAFYEKALKLDPNDQEILSNLNFVKNELSISEEESRTKSGLKNLNYLYAAVFILFWMTVLYAAYVLLLSQNIYRKKHLFVLSVFILITFFTTFKGIRSYIDNHVKIYAIAQKDMTLYSRPSHFSTEIYEIFNGQKIEVLQSNQGWTKIRTQNQKVGWVPSFMLIEINFKGK